MTNKTKNNNNGPIKQRQPLDYRFLAWYRHIVCGGVKLVGELSALPLTWGSDATFSRIAHVDNKSCLESDVQASDSMFQTKIKHSNMKTVHLYLKNSSITSFHY